MPTVTVYRNGATAGMAGRNIAPAKRDRIRGWSTGAVRRHTQWLYSIDAPSLEGQGIALTLTMRDTPATAEEFHALRRAWIMRLTRAGATRIHWVVEWQRRGTPHLHAAVYFPSDWESPIDAETIAVVSWVAVAGKFGTRLRAQHSDAIDGPLGWLKYLSKHAARGVKHYQRQGHPEGWDSSGRLWGHTGPWPVDTPMRFDMDREAYWRYRRLCRSWRVADARRRVAAARTPEERQKALSSLTFARRMLACPDPKLSAVRGVSDWIPEGVSHDLVTLLLADGFQVVEHSE